MDALIFAFLMFFQPNPHPRDELGIYMVPLAYSMEAWNASQAYPDSEPEALVATLIAEHGGKYPYPADSIGSSGEVGLMQVMNWERRRYNWCHDAVNATLPEEHLKECGVMEPRGRYITRDELTDYRASIEIAAFNLNRIHHTHKTARRCAKKVEVCTMKKVNGALITDECKMVPQKHSIVAHYRCGGDTRERCNTRYRDKLIKKLSYWREHEPLISALSAYDFPHITPWSTTHDTEDATEPTLSAWSDDSVFRAGARSEAPHRLD